MKHYRIVKKSTHLLIAISAVALFFNLALFGAIQAGLISMSRPAITQASDSCLATGGSIDIDPAQNNVQIGEMIMVHMKVPDSTKQYKYQLYAKDVTMGKQYEEGPEESINPADGGGKSTNIFFSGIGKKILYAQYSSFQDGLWCEYRANTNEITITVGDNSVDSANITIDVPDKTDETAGSITIKSTTSNAVGRKLVLSISKAGTCPNEDDNPQCWPTDAKHVYALNPVDVSPYELNFSFNFDGEEFGTHAVRIKLYSLETGLSLEKKKAYFTICEAGTANTTCTSNSSNSITNNGAEDPITVPSTIDAFSTFSSPFKMPSTIKGAGDLIQVIIVILEELLGAFAFIGIVVSGIQYISSGGDAAKAEKAKKNLIYCIIGIVVAVLALTLQSIIAKFWLGPS